MSTDEPNPPTVRPVKLTATHVTIKCPDCGDLHTHGRGDGYRRPHCPTHRGRAGHLVPVHSPRIGYIITGCEVTP